MNSLIYIEVIHQVNFTYQKGFIQSLKELHPEIETFDLDSHSDPSLFNYAIDLLRKSDRCLIYIKAENEASTGRIMLFLEEILKNKEKSLVILDGENKHIGKISRQLNTYVPSSDQDSTLQRIINFFKSGQ